MFHQGWLWYYDQNGLARELFNHARTATYLQTSERLGCSDIYGVLGDGGCEAFRFAPPGAPPLVLSTEAQRLIETNVTNQVLQPAFGYETTDEWTDRIYRGVMVDEAPWYSERYPESRQAIGFWVEEWTGLDSRHIGREMTTVGAYRGGGQFSVVGNNYREMAFQVLLLGETEQGLEYLYRWLDKQLRCQTGDCSSRTMLARRFCPDLDDDPDNVSQGVTLIRNVGLMTGIEWGSQVMERGSCFMRRITFTLAAEDPCLYSFDDDLDVTTAENMTNCFNGTSFNLNFNPCRPTCAQLNSACRRVFTFTNDSLGSLLPAVTLKTRSTGSQRTLPVRVRLYHDPAELGVANLCSLNYLSEINVGLMPNNSELVYDLGTKQILYTNNALSGFISGFPYLEPNEVGKTRFPSPCDGTFHLVVELNTRCLALVSGSTWRNAANNQFLLSTAFPTVEVKIRERLGCA